MTRSALRLSLIAAPLAFALASCGSSDETTGPGALEGDPVAAVPAPEGQEWSDTVTATEEGGYLVGNPDAPIKLVEYGALSCSHCAEFAEASNESLMADYVDSGRVSFELRLFLLNSFDLPAALLVTCSSEEAVVPLADQFWASQGDFFAKGQSAGDAAFEAIGSAPPEQRFVELAELYGMTDFITARGVARDQANACLADTGKVEALVAANEEAAATYDITGTPTFFINGEKIGSVGWPELEIALQKAGAR